MIIRSAEHTVILTPSDPQVNILHAMRFALADIRNKNRNQFGDEHQTEIKDPDGQRLLYDVSMGYFVRYSGSNCRISTFRSGGVELLATRLPVSRTFLDGITDHLTATALRTDLTYLVSSKYFSERKIEGIWEPRDLTKVDIRRPFYEFFGKSFPVQVRT